MRKMPSQVFLRFSAVSAIIERFLACVGKGQSVDCCVSLSILSAISGDLVNTIVYVAVTIQKKLHLPCRFP